MKIQSTFEVFQKTFEQETKSGKVSIEEITYIGAEKWKGKVSLKETNSVDSVMIIMWTNDSERDLCKAEGLVKLLAV